MRKLIISFLMILVLGQALMAQRYTISGYVRATNGGESLINASVFDIQSGKGCVSNTYGFYSITLPAGAVELRFTYVGLNAEVHKFSLSKDTVLNVQLTDNVSLSEILVVGERKGLDVKSSQMSAINIPIAQLKNIPSLLGESDIIKAMQLMPGVKAGNEGAAGMHVRGGGPDENLLLLDGVPIYNVNHMMGFFSVFNTDAIKDVTLYKGSFPARFGGRLSSIVDVRMKDGNDKALHGNVSIGLISSKFNLEGPLLNGKTTFNVSGRRTYADILAAPVIAIAAKIENAKGNAGYYFYDFNAKISHKFSDKDKLFLSFYSGDDVIKFNAEDNNSYGEWYKVIDRSKLDWKWGNVVSALRWNHVISNKLFMNTTASLTKYRFNMSVESGFDRYYFEQDSTINANTKIGFNSEIMDYSAKVVFDWMPNPNHDIKFGVNYINHSFKPGVNVLQELTITNAKPLSNDTIYGDMRVGSHEMSAYIEDDFTLSKRIKINAGLHYSVYFTDGKIYNALPSPRLSARYLVDEQLSFKAAYASMNQYVHLLSNSNISLPTDLWVPVTKRIPPMQSHQYSAGAFYNFKNIIDFSVEAYYKTMDNLIEYKDGASFLGGASELWEDKVHIGRGLSYGIELMAQKTVGKTTGWVSYTWSRALRIFDKADNEINSGKWFPAKYDRPHSFTVVGMHKFSDKFDISANWIISSGQVGSLALQRFDGGAIPPYNDYNKKFTMHNYSYLESRNNYRFDAYHRLDVGMNFHKQKKNGVRTWNISVFNVYNKLNPFIVRQKTIHPDPVNKYKYTLVLEKVSIFPIIPSVSYSYKF